MSFYYKFYNPSDMSLITEGKFTDMPFYFTNLPINPIQFSDYSENSLFNTQILYSMTGIMNRKMAEQYQTVMENNKTFFTDLMDKYDTNCLIYRIE